MNASWVLKKDRFLLEGTRGWTVFTTSRDLSMDAGTFAPADLRAVAEKAGVAAEAIAGMQQVHGRRVLRVEKREDQVAPSCDGLVTERSDVALAVRTADCLPVILYAPNRDFLGAAHAGWRGLREGVLSELVRVLGTAQVWAAIGPGIGSCCYEVGPEFEGYFPGFVQSREGKRFLDLGGAARLQLVQAGVREEAILQAPWCTACTPECHSYRRDGGAARRMVTFAQRVY